MEEEEEEDDTNEVTGVRTGPGKRLYIVVSSQPSYNTYSATSSNPAHEIKLYDVEPVDVLLHFNILSSSRSYYHQLIQRGELTKLIQERTWLIEKLACMRASGRSVDQKAVLLSAGIYYILHEDKRQIFIDNINKLCRIPTDLFALMNIVANEDVVRNNFKD